MSDVGDVLVLVTALGAGLVAGVFFAFSNFVMKALARLPVEQGIGAMRSINRSVITPLFMTALFGTALACLVVSGFALTSWQESGAPLRLVGGLTYVVGTGVVTIAGNVPLNDALERVSATGPEGSRVWSVYLRRWTSLNHVRTIAALLAALLLTIAYRG